MPRTFIELISSYRETTTVHSADEAAGQIRSVTNLVTLDVREPAEFQAASIPGAVNIPRGFLEFKIAEACPTADQAILIHCKTGGRAILAARTLAEMGYQNVSVYQGSLDDLLAALE